ncbi:MAG: hypothetical protein ACRDRP_22740 [Pseudonocardiaceae bacterium]
MSETSRHHPGPSVSTASAGDTLTLFAFLWAVAAIFHVLGPSGRATQVIANPTTLGISHALLAICAIWLLARPTRNVPLLLVAGLGLITAGLEAPILGNHWLVAAFVNLALLLCVLGRARAGGIDRVRLADVLLPLARWCLVLFYAFAAFAKLNSDFFDTAVSCSTFYFDETVRSFGLVAPATVGAGGLANFLPVATAMTELSVPVLLLIRRTRAFGVVLGLGFHSVVALDRVHPFIDFSAVLAALFLLFLPAQFASKAAGYLQGRGARLVISWMAAAVVVLAAEWVGRNAVVVLVSVVGTWLLWYVLDAALLLGVGIWLARHRGQPLDQPFKLRGKGPIWLAAVPVLLVINGLLPYVELRTGYAYTMYSNLRMVDGRSNHLIVRASLPLAGRQADLVKVVSSDDPGLAQYSTYNYLLTWDSFRTYLAKHPGAAVTYERSGERHVVKRASDDRELITSPPLLVRKLLAMRAVDGNDHARCQDGFLPAL